MTDIPAPPPTTSPDPAEQARLGLGLNELNSRLCAAMRVDADTNLGFRLTVLGGQFPQLEVYPVAPVDEGGHLSDPWSSPLGDAVIPTTYALLPGGDAIPVQIPPPLLPPELIDPDVEADHTAARLLRMCADVINGAGCSADTRDWMTSAAHSLADSMASRVFGAKSMWPNDRRLLIDRLGELIGLSVTLTDDDHAAIVLPGGPDEDRLLVLTDRQLLMATMAYTDTTPDPAEETP